MKSKLDEWLAAETAQKASFEAGVGPGVVQADQVAGLDGLAVFQATMAGLLPTVHIAHIAHPLDFMLIEVA